MKKRHRRRYNNHIWVYSIIACICLLTMGIGYALLSAENNFNVDVTKTTPPGAGDTIKELLGSSTSVASGTGTLEKIEQPATTQTTAQTEYRYRGKNPNNYVTFNNELWRIIGIVDRKVKLIKNASIGDKKWNDSETNEWPRGSLRTYLNGNYYTGLTATAQSMIEESTWYLGGWNTEDIKTNVMYQKERGRSTKWEGYVGLMYPSDYGYASSEYSSDTLLSDTYLCEHNWLCKNESPLWTITPDSDNSTGVFTVCGGSEVNIGNVYSIYERYNIYPTAYLDINVQIVSGDGSESNPYILTLS